MDMICRMESASPSMGTLCVFVPAIMESEGKSMVGNLGIIANDWEIS